MLKTLISETDRAEVFSLVADGTADLRSIEHRAICIRYIDQDENNKCIV